MTEDHGKFLECYYLTGSTACGKTEVGLRLAEMLEAEILSLDSMAIYRGMDIGTAKPNSIERAQVPHHLLDLVEPGDDFSVARYVDAAHVAVADILGRGRRALFIGGTPLYLKSLLRGIFSGPEADWEFRQQVAAELETAGPEALHARLTQVDPVTAARLHPNDTRRLIRALEVYKITGEPISHQQREFDEGHSADACHVFVLDRDRSDLHARINARVERMFERGLIEEVQRLTADGRELSHTAQQAVGYREVLGHLAGELTIEQAIEQCQARTRRFAKRQGTWFRSLSECRMVSVGVDAESGAVAEEIAAVCRQG